MSTNEVVTEDGILPEIHLHSEYMNWFKSCGVRFKAWGSAGPDFILTNPTQPQAPSFRLGLGW